MARPDEARDAVSHSSWRLLDQKLAGKSYQNAMGHFVALKEADQATLPPISEQKTRAALARGGQARLGARRAAALSKLPHLRIR